jgi:aldose sugar dehydrogenase
MLSYGIGQMKRLEWYFLFKPYQSRQCHFAQQMLSKVSFIELIKLQKLNNSSIKSYIMKYFKMLGLTAATVGSLFFCSCSESNNPSGSAPSPIGNPTGNNRTVINTLSVPWEILWGPDNFIWTTERNGRISRINPETGSQTVIHTVSNVYQVGDAGLLGMVLHPSFPTQPYLYTMYTQSNNNSARGRVVRFTYSNNTLTNETVLLDNIPASSTHNGSRLLIQNNFLYVTTGDAGNTSLSQNRSSLAGKILRMNIDGSIPADNPFPNSYIWSYGHRNAQGLLLHSNGNIYSSEHGPTSDDEFNLICKGDNYGWPEILGVTDNQNEQNFASANPVSDPISFWATPIAPSDIVYYTSSKIPTLQNKILMTVLKDQMMVALTLSSDGKTVTNREVLLQNQFGRLRDICVSPDGRIFIATNGPSFSSSSNHSIIELTGL